MLCVGRTTKAVLAMACSKALCKVQARKANVALQARGRRLFGCYLAWRSNEWKEKERVHVQTSQCVSGA